MYSKIAISNAQATEKATKAMFLEIETCKMQIRILSMLNMPNDVYLILALLNDDAHAFIIY